MQQPQIDPNTTPSSMPPLDLPGLPGYVVCVSAHCQHDRMIAIHIYDHLTPHAQYIKSQVGSVPFGCSNDSMYLVGLHVHLPFKERLCNMAKIGPRANCCHAPCICTPCYVHMYDRVRACSMCFSSSLPACPLRRFLALLLLSARELFGKLRGKKRSKVIGRGRGDGHGHISNMPKSSHRGASKAIIERASAACNAPRAMGANTPSSCLEDTSPTIKCAMSSNTAYFVVL
ncbi:hypothetical protein V8C26DRAFT_197068 [Trichoderma gracile]